MRKRFARWLRKIAQRLDPQTRTPAPTPLEFMGTIELAEEIHRRNDGVLLIWWKAAERVWDGQRVRSRINIDYFMRSHFYEDELALRGYKIALRKKRHE